MIKPDAVEKGHIGGILSMITEAGFRIVALKLTQLTVADAQKFYAVHSARPFYGELVEFMSRGPIVAAILEKENAVEEFQEAHNLNPDGIVGPKTWAALRAV